jgi:iron complex transport system substrate-binding protein
MGALFSTLRALEAEGMILASNEYVSRNSAFFPVISQLPSIGTAGQLDFELIFELNPDVIFCKPSSYHLFNDVFIDEFPIVQVTFETVEDIQKLGAILDKEKEADEYIDWIQSYTDSIDRKVSGLKKEEYQEVFIYYGGEYGMSLPPPYGTFGKENLRNALVKRAGGKSISENIEGGWITVDPEWVVEQNPPVIIRECYITSEYPEMGYSVNGTSCAEVLLKNIVNQPALSKTKAVTDEKVFMIYGDLFEDSWFLGLAYLAKVLQPGIFKDLDPVQMHQDFLTRFQRLTYDVREQGLFTYMMSESWQH